MKINELLENINPMSVLEIKNYIPVKEKKKFVMDVIMECTDDVDNFISVDRFKMNIYFNMRIMELYTNLEVSNDFDEMIAEYDALCESDILQNAIAQFQDEYDMTYSILEGELDELLVQNSIDAQVVRIANKINDMLDMIQEKVESVDLSKMLPDGTDVAQLMDMLKLLK